LEEEFPGIKETRLDHYF